jgi:hypothetical protein
VYGPGLPVNIDEVVMIRDAANAAAELDRSERVDCLFLQKVVNTGVDQQRNP